MSSWAAILVPLDIDHDSLFQKPPNNEPFSQELRWKRSVCWISVTVGHSKQVKSLLLQPMMRSHLFFSFYYSLKSMGTAEYQEPNHRCKSLHPTRIIFIIFDMWLILVSFWKCGFHSISDIMWYLSRRSGTSGWREGSWAAENCWQGRRRYFTSTFQVLLRCTSTLTPSAATLQSRSANLSLLRGRRQTGLVRRRK